MADNGFEEAAKLGGFFMAHAVWCISDNGPLVPLIGHVGPSGRQMVRFASEQMEESVRQAKTWLEKNPEKALLAAFVFDGFATFGGVRKDALISTVIEFGPPRRSLEIIVPYRPHTAGGGFAVHKPKFTGAVGIPTEALSELAGAFFQGVDSHEKGAKVWADHLDESF